MADRVGAGFLDGEHDVVDRILVGAVEREVLADTVAGAQQA